MTGSCRVSNASRTHVGDRLVALFVTLSGLVPREAEHVGQVLTKLSSTRDAARSDARITPHGVLFKVLSSFSIRGSVLIHGVVSEDRRVRCRCGRDNT